MVQLFIDPILDHINIIGLGLGAVFNMVQLFIEPIFNHINIIG